MVLPCQSVSRARESSGLEGEGMRTAPLLADPSSDRSGDFLDGGKRVVSQRDHAGIGSAFGDGGGEIPSGEEENKRVPEESRDFMSTVEKTGEVKSLYK